MCHEYTLFLNTETSHTFKGFAASCRIDVSRFIYNFRTSPILYLMMCRVVVFCFEVCLGLCWAFYENADIV